MRKIAYWIGTAALITLAVVCAVVVLGPAALYWLVVVTAVPAMLALLFKGGSPVVAITVLVLGIALLSFIALMAVDDKGLSWLYRFPRYLYRDIWLGCLFKHKGPFIKLSYCVYRCSKEEDH